MLGPFAVRCGFRAFMQLDRNDELLVYPFVFDNGQSAGSVGLNGDLL